MLARFIVIMIEAAESLESFESVESLESLESVESFESVESEVKIENIIILYTAGPIVCDVL